MRRLSFCILLIVFGRFADAGQEAGNGGDIVYCNQNGKVTIHLYDYFEAQNPPFGRNIDLGPGFSFDQKINYVFARIEKLNPLRAKRYRNWYKTFMTEAFFVKGAELIDVPDTGGGYIPIGCQLKQAATQNVEPFLPGQMRYLISNDLWVQFDEITKAGLILHELILREAIANHHKNSILARYFHGWLASRDLEKFDQMEYIDLVSQVKYSDANIGSLPIFVEKLWFYEPAHKIKMAYIVPGEEVEYTVAGQSATFQTSHELTAFYENGQVIGLPGKFPLKRFSLKFSDSKSVLHLGDSSNLYCLSFNPDGSFARVASSWGVECIDDRPVFLEGEWVDGYVESLEIVLNSMGEIKSVNFQGGRTKLAGEYAHLTYGTLYSNGRLEKAGFVGQVHFPTPTGTIKSSKDGGAHFSPDGVLTAAWIDDTLPVFGGQAHFDDAGISSFYETGAIEYGHLAEDTVMFDEFDQAKMFPGKNSYSFTKDGKVKTK